MEIFLGIAILLICFSLITFVRNNIVYKFRASLINLISERNQDDINNGLGFTGWRFVEFNTVSYDEMVWKFWRRCSSFYKDKRFFIEIEQRKN
jgi:hypothetical protein